MSWDENEGPGSSEDSRPSVERIRDSRTSGFGSTPGFPVLQGGFGRYRPIASLGQGGMARVYLAVALGPAGFNKLMVIKALRDESEHSEEFARMFLDEARLAARLNHPNIVQTYEIGEVEPFLAESDDPTGLGCRYYIAMEYLEGQPLRVVQRRLGRIALPLEEELRIYAETARGLHHAHELRGLHGEFLGVVHRDVSPQNVFLTYDGQVKLLDFGIAKARDAEHLSKVGLIKGKLDYIAPEQIRGEKLDRRADVFSLGAMLWESVTGQRFAGGSGMADVAKMHRRLTGGEPPCREVNPDVPERLQYVVERARALDPAERFPTALAFADELEELLKAMGMHPTARTLSERLSAPFSLERSRIAAVIEQQVREAVHSQRQESLPNIGRSELNQSSTGLDLGPVILPGERHSRPPSGVISTQAAPSITPPPQAPGMSAPKLGAIAAALVGAAALALLMREEAVAPAAEVRTPAPDARASERADTTVQTPGASASTPLEAAGYARERNGEVPARLPETPQIKVQIQVLPAEAQATLDGSNITQLPFSAELALDGKLHHVEASAPGYQSKRVLLPFDRDRDLIIVLDPMPSEATRAHSGRRRSGEIQAESIVPSSASLTPSVPLPGEKLSTQVRVPAAIDTKNPYED